MSKLHWRQSCDGKVAYPSRRTAIEAMRKTNMVRDFIGKDRTRFNVYPCRYCGAYHLGTAANKREAS